MGQATRGTGLVAAGIGWGIAAGVALGTLLIAPALEGSLGTGSVTASEAGQGDAASDSGELARANGRLRLLRRTLPACAGWQTPRVRQTRVASV